MVLDMDIEIIKVRVDDIEDIYHQFDNKDISDELATFIENRCSRTSKTKVHLEIITKNELTNNQKDKVVTAIRSHYGLETKFIEMDIRRLKKVNIYYFIAGLLIILIANALPIGKYIPEVIDILGGFIIYESSFNLLFTDSELDMKIDRAKKIGKAHIYFSKDKE